VPNPKTSEKSNYLDREENITRGELSAKKVALYSYDAETDTLNPFSNGLKPVQDFDKLTVTNSDTNEDTLTYTKASSPVQTVKITYKAGVEKISDTFEELEYS
jgi:hypothetical protein